MTLQLNNPDFDWKSLQNFFQLDYLVYLICIVLLAILAKVIFQKITFPKNIHIELQEDIILAEILTSFYISSNQMLSRVLENTFLTTNSGSFFKIRFNIFLYSLGFYILFFILNLCLLKAFKDLKNKQATLKLVISTSVILATIFNYTIQSAIKETGKHYEVFITPGATIFQIIIFSLIFILIFLIINRYIAASVFIITLGTILSIVNTLKYNARFEPLLPSDLIWLKDITFFKDYISFPIMSIILALLIVAFVGVYFIQNRLFIGNIIDSIKVQLTLITLLLSICIAPIYFLKQTNNQPFPKNIPIASSVFNVFDINWLGVNANTRFRSLSYVWLKNSTIDKMSEPANYSKTNIKKIYLKYEQEAKQINANRPNNIRNQTTIFILSESLSDPTKLKGIQSSQSPIPFINTIMQNTTSGQMISDGYGGGTANMEFQSLTGLPFTNFSNSVSVAYSEIVPIMKNLPSVSDFYDPQNRTVIHLNAAQNYNRTTVYKKLNFNKFIALSGGDITAPIKENYGSYPSDESTYDNILNELDQTQSQFIYAMSMQNHGPYHNPQKDFDISGHGFTESENNALKDYADRLSETDRATQNFLTQLESINKDITVVFFGDHLPGLYPTEFFDNQLSNKQKTDYFIWSNHNDNSIEHSEIRSNDFPALLFKTTQSKISPYYALLTATLPSEKHKLNNQSKEDLKLIQYDLTVGKNYLAQYPNFFKISK